MKAFISSTSQDLATYRKAAYDVCSRLEILPIGMEQFEAMGVGATSGSLHKLDEAHVYVGIFANRYGYIEGGYDRSVTELEFDYAETRGLDRLCFLATDAAGLPVYPENADKLAAFKARINTLIRREFTTAGDLQYELYHSLLKWLFRQHGGTTLARHVFDPLFAQYSRFAGRADVLATVQQFIDSPGSGYLAITAPAGYGKTALATRIIDRNRDVAAYHFFTTLYGSNAASEFLSELFFVKNATEQMRLWSFFPYDDRTAPTTLSEWVAAYQRALTTALREKHVLVLDGLDEVKAWTLRPYLMSPPADNLKVILTIRDVGQAWMTDFGLPPAHTTRLSLEGMTRDDVRHALRLAGPVAARFGETEALLNEVVAVTTPEGTVAGSDPLYVMFLADDIQKGDVTDANLVGQPRRLEDYLSKWWNALVADADNAAVDLLATLAVALGPIRADDLRAVHTSLKRTLTKDPIEATVQRLRRTIAGTAHTGYAFAHPRFRDYVRKLPDIAPYEAALRDYAASWQQHRGRYAFEYVAEHLARSGNDDRLFATVLDPVFQSSQRNALGSARRTLSDLALAVTRACDADRALDALRCAAAHRRIANSEGVAKEIFATLAKRQYDVAAQAVQAYAVGVKSSSVWVLALRCYLICAATKAGDHDGAVMLIDRFERQLGLAYHGASHHAAALCDTLIASAVVIDPALATEIGVDAGWAPQAITALAALPPRDPGRVAEVRDRVMNLELTLGDTAAQRNVSAVEFIDEERAGEYTMRLRDALISVAGDPVGREMVDRAIAALLHNPYPRYRDNGLVALAIAAQANPDWLWAKGRIETILETGLEREGITFTYDLAAQLVAEAETRGMATGQLGQYLDRAATTKDRWASALRCASARAAAAGTQRRIVDANALVDQAVGVDSGFAGYAVTHVLSLASRYCELGNSGRIGALGLFDRARNHARRVRDPRFGAERAELVNQFEQWLASPTPAWQDVVAKLRVTPDADMRRAFKDLVSARWSAEGRRENWGGLVVASLADATALDTVLGRLFGRAIRGHHAGARQLSEAALAEAMAICVADIATSCPWDLGVPAYA